MNLLHDVMRPFVRKPDNVEIAGKITEVFAHRFVVQTTAGKVLADIGPKAAKTIRLEANVAVRIEGERKASEIKVSRIAIGDGEMQKTHHGGPKHDKHHGKPFGPLEASAMARHENYEVVGDLRPHKKHFEATATKNGRTFNLHIHRDGIREH